MDQVGVKAPGRPSSTTFLSAQKSFTLIFLGGKPWWSSTEGIVSPTVAKLLVRIAAVVVVVVVVDVRSTARAAKRGAAAANIM